MTARNTTARNRHRAAIARDKPPCALCGQPIDYDLPVSDPKSFVVDHIVPLNKGGADAISNCQAAHRDCNREKSDHLESPVLRVSGILT